MIPAIRLSSGVTLSRTPIEEPVPLAVCHDWKRIPSAETTSHAWSQRFNGMRRKARNIRV